MSFGEHLEELRVVLVRALIGVAVGCVFGFLLAEQVVQILTSPLEEAQVAFEREDAELRLKQEFDYVPPEYVPYLEEGMVPRAVMVDRGQFESLLRSYFPDMKSNIEGSTDPYGFRSDQFKPDQLAELCQQWAAHDAGELAEKRAAVWELLTPQEQSAIRQIANTPILDEAETSRALETLVAVFNRLSALEQLSQQSAFAEELKPPEWSWTSLFNEAKPNALIELKATLDSPETSEIDRPIVLRRLNRALLVGLFPDQTNRVRLDLRALEIWETVDYQPQALGVGESFFVWLKAGLFTGITFAGPWVFYQLWSFVASGLYPHEKRYIHWFLPISIMLFVGGVLLAFFFVFKPVLAFLFSFNRSLGIAPEMRIGEWLSFAMFLPLGFGVAFQLPLVMLFANRVGLIDVATYIAKWRIAVMIIFVLAMFLTPADPISLLLLAIPLTFLYFTGIAMCKWMPRNQNPFGDDAVTASPS